MATPGKKEVDRALKTAAREMKAAIKKLSRGEKLMLVGSNGVVG